MKILDNFADNFQKGGLAFLVFIGFLCYVGYRLLQNFLPDPKTPEESARIQVVESVKNQVEKANLVISTQDKVIASRIHLACNSFFKDTATMESCLAYMNSANKTKAVFVAYGVREHSILWFEPKKYNLVEAIMWQYGGNSEIGKKYQKIFSNANLS